MLDGAPPVDLGALPFAGAAAAAAPSPKTLLFGVSSLLPADEHNVVLSIREARSVDKGVPKRSGVVM